MPAEERFERAEAPFALAGVLRGDGGEVQGEGVARLGDVPLDDLARAREDGGGAGDGARVGRGARWRRGGRGHADADRLEPGHLRVRGLFELRDAPGELLQTLAGEENVDGEVERLAEELDEVGLERGRSRITI